MSNRPGKKIPEEQKSPRKRIYMKPKAGNSFSISKKRYGFKTMTRQQEKKWTKEASSQTDPSSSTSTKSSMDDDEWETETSIEKMRSAELTSVDESVIPPPELVRDKDIASLVFLSESYCPIAFSTPRFFSDGKSIHFSVNIDSLKEALPSVSPTMKSDVVTKHGELPTIPNVSFGDEFAKEKDPLEDEGFEMKPISPEQSVQLPNAPDDVNYENQEQSEGSMDSNERKDQILSPFKKHDDAKRRDAIACSAVPSDGFDISEDSDASTVPYFAEDQISPFKKHDKAERRDSIACCKNSSSDCSNISQDSDASTVPNVEVDQEYSEDNTFQAAVVNKLKNSNSRKRRQKDKVENSFEDMDDYSNGEDFGDTRILQIDSSKKKLGNHRVNNRLNESIARWKQRNEGVNFLEYESDSEEHFENVQKIQTKEFQNDELFNNQPQAVGSQIKSGGKVFAGVDNKRQQDKGTRFVKRSQNSISLRKEHKNKNENLFEDVEKSDSQNSFETVLKNQQKTATHQKKTNNRIKFASILSRSTNSNRKGKNGNKTGHFSEDVDSCNRVDNFEEAETPKRKGMLHRNIRFGKRIKTPHRRKHRNKGGNLFANDCDDSFETIQNEPNDQLLDDELDNNQPEASTYRTNGKIKYAGVDNLTLKDVNIINRSQSSLSLKKKHENEGEYLFEDVHKNDSEDSFQNFQNVQHEELTDDELDHNIPETSAHHIKRKSNIHVEDDNMKQQNASISNRSPSSANLRRKHKNEGENLFEDMDKNEGEDRFENFQNVQHEELQDDELDDNISETSAPPVKRKNNMRVVADDMMQQNASISNGSQRSAHLKSKHKNKGKNSFGDLGEKNNAKRSENNQKIRNRQDKAGNSSEYAYNSEDNFEEAHNAEINTSKKKRKPHSVGVKRNRRVNKSRKAANSLNRSKNSTSREVSIGLQNRKNEEEWNKCHRCYIEASSHLGQTFRILKPVFRDDYPIDSIMLLNYGLMESKKKCKH